MKKKHTWARDATRLEPYAPAATASFPLLR